MTTAFKLFATVLLSLCIGASSVMAADIQKFTEPVLITSLGQSPDAKTLSILAKRTKLNHEFLPFASTAEIKKAKTVLITVGTSLKGFGSAGVNIDTETKRCKDIIAAAKTSGAQVILVHIGGEGRRDSMTNVLLEALAPSADAFIVYKEGNKDGFFTKAAGSKPLVLLPKTINIVKLLTSLNPNS